MVILAATSIDAVETMPVELVVWGVIAVVFVIAIIWAIVSRIRQERNEEKYEDRDN